MKTSLPIKQAKQQFIEDWGVLALNWGITRQTGRVHGYLLTRAKPVSYGDIQKDLSMGVGASNSAILELLQIGIVHQTSKSGERSFYFEAEKDMWVIAKAVARERRRRELDPLVRSLSNYDNITGPNPDVREFKELIKSIQTMADVAAKTISLFERSGMISFLKLL